MSIINVENIGKRYRIGERERYLALRDLISRAATSPLRLFSRHNGASSNSDPTHIWALKNVSFDIREGEVVGIVGRNGAGKTTLLKILARVTKPTAGFAEVRGRMGSLLEVGTGFHPELTGRENTFLSGAILGMRKTEIQHKFDEIVAFAEVEKFIDTPLKHYSTGMQMRLAFAVAAHLEPEILLVDEVLSVGDIQFQKKCMGKMGDVAKAGRTILFVSHQMNQIRRLCGRVIWIDRGGVQMSGPAGDIVSKYESVSTNFPLTPRANVPNVKAYFQSWEIVEPESGRPHILDSNGPLTVRFILQAKEQIINASHGIALYSSERQLLWGTAFERLHIKRGAHQFTYSLPGLPLKPGAYNWRVTLFDVNGLVDDWDCLPDLLVTARPVTHWKDEWAGILNIPPQFSVLPLEVLTR